VAEAFPVESATMTYLGHRLYPLMLLAALLVCMSPVHAEGGCPPGQYPQSGQGWQTCVPIPGASGVVSQPAKVVHWMDRYGAIVSDPEAGAIGASISQQTQTIAEQKATSDCEAKGGKKCTLDIVYGNKCAALVSGDRQYNVKSGITLLDAEQKAMQGCHDNNCRVFYSGCSPPESY
jgi:hypothetical protein